MTPDQIIEAIKTLNETVRVNSGLLGSDSTADQANAKIKQLMAMLPVGVTVLPDKTLYNVKLR